MISRLSSLCLLATVTVIGSGCDRDDSLPHPSEPRRDVPLSESSVSRESFPTVSSNGQAAASRDAFVSSAEKKLKEIDDEMDELSRKAANLRDDTKTRAEQALASLREQRTKVSSSVEQLRASSAETWHELKRGFDAAVMELESAFETAKSKVRQEVGRPQ